MHIITAKEKRVLGALYKLGDAPISSVAKETLINRTALYHTIDGLLAKGLITKMNKQGVAYFQPLPLSAYADWSKRQMTSLLSQTSELEEWLAQQKAEGPTLHSDIRYFEGVEGVKNLYDDSWRDNEGKVIYAITDYDRAYTSLSTFLEKEYFPRRVQNGIRVHSLLPKNSKTGHRDIQRAKALLREMRFLDLFKDLGIEVNVYGSKVSIVAFDPKKPSGVIIKNEIIAKAFKAIFQHLWKSAKGSTRKN